MNLDNFISETIKSLIKGINDAKVFAKENGARINPEFDNRRSVENSNANVVFFKGRDGAIGVSTIDFDIAVSVSNTQGSEGGGGINVYALKLGGSINENEMNETVSRIKFSLNIVLPSDPA
ncbi:MAG: hypothetical protein JNN32_03060 [Flavobacteriales bacterium]|nr:hypothetical protein [Flavobacteriales bacterium]